MWNVTVCANKQYNPIIISRINTPTPPAAIAKMASTAATRNEYSAEGQYWIEK